METSNGQKIAILSIDGGGIRGIIPAVILDYLEKRLQEKAQAGRGQENSYLCEYFDFFAGTSTGGILSCAYIAPNHDGTSSEYSAEDALNIYLKRGKEIFDVSLFEKITRMGNIRDERYPSEAINRVLEAYFGNIKLSEVLKPCMITAYDFEKRQSKFFTSIDALKNKRDDFLLKDVARATSAAPTYFEPAAIRSQNDIPFHLMDGGVFANNPALCAYSEVRKIPMHVLQEFKPEKTRDYYNDHSQREIKKEYHPCIADMIFLSLSTGKIQKEYKYDNFKNRGAPTWITPVIDILMSANAETVQYQMKKIYESIGERESNKNKDEMDYDYFRLEPDLYDASPEMDNASTKNINALRDAGLRFIDDNGDLLDKIVEKLQGSYVAIA